MSKKYYGFTLVEMLIVMGIIIILMVVGVTAGRFAINRANDVAHKNAADQIYTSLQAYYTDFREYPSEDSDDICQDGCTIAGLVGSQDSPGELVPYIDEASFNGGAEASYFYGVGGDGGDQAVLVCVTLRGEAEANSEREDGEIYCSGNGIGVPLVFENTNTVIVENKTLVNAEFETSFDQLSSGGSLWDKGWISTYGGPIYYIDPVPPPTY